MTINFQKLITICTTNWPVNLAGFFVFTAFCTFSCKNPKKVSLENQLSDNPAGVYYTDTFTVHSQTVILDTPSTENKANLIAGSFTDGALGTVTAESFTQLEIKDTTALHFNTADSLTLTINTEFIQGNPSGNLVLNLYALASPVDSATAYNRLSDIPVSTKIDSFTLNSAAPATYTFQSRALLDFLVNFKDKDFISSFPGLALKASTNTSYAVGLRTGETGFYITLYTNGKTKNFTIFSGNKSQRFTKADFTGDPEAIKSAANPLGYMNDLFGIGAVLKVPGLNSFLNNIRNQFVVSEASFIVPSADGFVPGTNKVNPRLYMFETDSTGNRFKTGEEFKMVQYAFDLSTSRYNGPSVLKNNNNVQYGIYDQNNNRFNFPYTPYVREIETGKRKNTPVIASVRSVVTRSSAAVFTQSPFTYLFQKGSGASERVKFVVYYNKVGL